MQESVHLPQVKACWLPWPMKTGQFMVYDLLLQGNETISRIGNVKVRQFIPQADLEKWKNLGFDQEKQGNLLIGFGNGPFDYGEEITRNTLLSHVVFLFGGEKSLEDRAEFLRILAKEQEFCEMFEEKQHEIDPSETGRMNEFVQHMLGLIDFLWRTKESARSGWIHSLFQEQEKAQSPFASLLARGYEIQKKEVMKEIRKTLEEHDLLRQGMEVEPLAGFGTHERPHLDELRALWLLSRYGRFFHPAIEEIFAHAEERIIFSRQLLSKRSWQEWQEKGYWLIGVGNGPLDEHQGNATRKPGSSASLVAEKLRINEIPEVKEILHINGHGGESLFSILSGAGLVMDERLQDTLRTLPRSVGYGLYSLHGLVQAMNRNGMDPLFVFAIVSAILDQYYLQYRRYSTLIEAIDCGLEEGSLMTKNDHGDSVVMRYGILPTPSPNDEVANLAFQRKPHLHLIIHKIPSGNLGIFFRKNNGHFFHESVTLDRLQEFARMLAVEECHQRDVMPPNFSEAAIRLESGLIPGCPWWNFDARGTITNFSLSDPEREPTVLDVKSILRLVEIAFSKEFCVGCDARRCVSCRWNTYELDRCVEKRDRVFRNGKKVCPA